MKKLQFGQAPDLLVAAMEDLEGPPLEKKWRGNNSKCDKRTREGDVRAQKCPERVKKPKAARGPEAHSRGVG